MLASGKGLHAVLYRGGRQKGKRVWGQEQERVEVIFITNPLPQQHIEYTASIYNHLLLGPTSQHCCLGVSVSNA